MSKYPRFSELGYQVVQELGRNRSAGRITYLANTGNIHQQVVLKEFRFADSGTDWSGFKAYEREIEVLKHLNHSRVPRYLNSFEIPQGFCLVQEYKKAPSLGLLHSFNAESIKQIAMSVLEILVYLQQRVPPIIHRDIKPENILVDEQLNAYLVDFGFARIRGGEVALSSVAAGTPGFMPPEEHFGRTLTEASDLYSLGATLICLITGTRSVDISKLIDDNYRFNFKKLVPQLSSRFLEWLTKMVEPNLKHRYPNAAAALEALQPIPMKEAKSSLRTLVGAIKLRQPAAILGLATVSLLTAGVVKPWVIQQQGSVIIQQDNSPIVDKQSDAVEQLLVTNNCESCNLQEADLGGASLERANLWLAYLRGANLRGADLVHAYLGDAYMGHAYLKGADLGGAYLKGANFGDADLEGADLGGAYLKDANLRDANLKSANLPEAYLEGANLKDANLKGANLKNANLRDANLRGANLNHANLKGAIMPDGTIHN